MPHRVSSSAAGIRGVPLRGSVVQFASQYRLVLYQCICLSSFQLVTGVDAGFFTSLPENVSDTLLFESIWQKFCRKMMRIISCIWSLSVGALVIKVRLLVSEEEKVVQLAECKVYEQLVDLMS